MLSIRAIGHGSGYRFYLEQESIGEWVGEGSAMLGLTGEVTAEEFRAVRQGLNPQTGEPLRPRTLVDRTYQKDWGIEVYRARALYDMTISAPKSFSVQWLVDPRILEAHYHGIRAVSDAMQERAGAMVIAAYHHRQSRLLDPQIHSHLVAANLANTHGRWWALDSTQIYKSQQELTAIYRSAAAVQAERLGYDIAYPE